MYKQHNDTQGAIKWNYCVISEKAYHINLGQYHTYGIQLTGPNCNEILHDVSVDKLIVYQMTELFNRHQLSHCHLKNAVEDLLP